MRDLLTAEEDAAAAQDGWGLHDVYDLSAQRWRVMVLGTPNAETASRRVVERARQGSAIAIKALRLVVKGVPAKPAKGKKR